jgi:linoleoyl-CoA desaturase
MATSLSLVPLWVVGRKEEFVDDFWNIISGRIGEHRFPRPTAWELVVFVTGKTAFFTWAFVIPLFFHPLNVVIFYYIIGVLVLGVTLSVVFQLPHCVEEAEFPIPREDTGKIVRPWAVHQAYVTVDYGRSNPVLSWLFGGLNFHKEHHLFPTICHIHYSAITKIVEETCRDHGIKYSEHKSFRAGIKAHYRWLQKMGKPNNQN